jgi:Uma2 family endonuclease
MSTSFGGHNDLVQQSRRHYTVADYLMLQKGAGIKLEYLGGEIWAMAGGTRAHERISGNLFALLHNMLRDSRCEPFSGNMRVTTPSGLWTYPDISIVCGEAEVIGHDDETTLTNPVALVEVLSDSTRDYDHGEKFDLYSSIPTLKHYLLIEQRAVEVEHRWRNETGTWSSETLSSLDETVTLKDLGIDLPLSRIYERVGLP